MKNTIIDIMVVLAIPIVLGGGYYYFQGSEATDTNTGVDDQLAEKTKAVSEDIKNLSSITFDTSVFDNMKYLKVSRHDSEKPPTGVFTRKANPFVR